MTSACSIREITVGRHLRAVVLENDRMAVTVLVDKGADIFQLVYKPRQLDVLWKAPWELRAPGSLGISAPDPLVTWMDYYPGGWQELFPNGGAACSYKGAPLPFHGEVAVVPWSYAIVENNPNQVSLHCTVNTARLPFRLERVMSLSQHAPILTMHERLTNQSPEALDFMWGHHPAYGAPFLSEHCRLDIPAGHYESDDGYDPPNNPILPGRRWPWPEVRDRRDRPMDLARPPAEGAGMTMLGYFTDLAEGWYAVTNTQLGVGIGLVWPVTVLPYVWFYQEYNGALGYPFFGRCYVMCVEPVSSYPGQGLEVALDKGTALHLAAGQSLEMDIKVVFFESNTGVQRLTPDGHVDLKA
jgi:hypothetical protein